MARRLGGGVLAAGLLASMAPAVQAGAAGTAATRGRPALTRFNPRVNAVAVARMRVRASSAAHAVGHTGIISGVVRTITGSPAGGACVTALGPGFRLSAKTGSDGRYMLGGLRPGQYQLRANACPNASNPAAHEAISASWSSGPASVTVRAGQIIHPAPISIFHLVLGSLKAPVHQGLSASAVRPRRGSISGQVTGQGRPLPGVCALVARLGGQGGLAERIVHTGKMGRYRITKLKPGRYEVAFLAAFGPSCPNKGNWLYQLYPGVNAPFNHGKVKPVRVRAGKDTGDIDGQLKKGGEISGTVRSKSGTRLAGICVDVIPTSGPGDGFDFFSATNKLGEYAARGLFRAGYQVEFSIGCRNKGNYAEQWWPGAPSPARAKTIRITGARQVGHINAALLPGASISGVVKAKNAAGKPLSGVCVSAGDNAFAQTGRDGRYRLIGLSAGPTEVQFDPACNSETGFSIYEFVQRSITLRTGQAVTGFNAYLPLGGGISGVVTDARGRPAGGVCVEINDDVGEVTRTHANGHYSMVGVENGRFQVFFFGGCGNSGSVAPQFYPNSPTSLFAKPIRFRASRITPNIDAKMQPGGTLAGTVTDTAGHKLSRICVGTSSPFGFLPTSIDVGVATAEGGRYQIANLAPGTYDLGFGCAGYGTEVFPNQVNFANAGLLSVNAGATTRVPVTRLSRAGAISGRVTSQSGKPVEYACVEVAPTASTNDIFPVDFTVANENGHYRFGGLAPARYLIEFFNCDQPGKLAPQWYRRAATVAHATPVKVIPGKTDTGINGALTVGGTITGRVVGPTGRPASNVCVRAFSTQAQFDSFGRTGRSGRYRIVGLSTGRWSLMFTPCAPNSRLAEVIRPGTVRVTAPHTVTGANFRLPLGGSVSGRVTSQAGGRPLGDVCVQLIPVNANGGFGFAVTDGHGRYVATQLKAGNYRAYIGDPSCNEFPDAVPPFAPQWYNGQPRIGTATVVHVSAGGTKTGISGALTPFGSVTGTVQTREHAPVSGECVTAVPIRAAADPGSGIPAERETAVTDRTGGYTLTALTPGKYKIEFTSGCGGGRFATQWWDNAASARSAKVIKVGFATIKEIDATLRK